MILTLVIIAILQHPPELPSLLIAWKQMIKESPKIVTVEVWSIGYLCDGLQDQILTFLLGHVVLDS